MTLVFGHPRNTLILPNATRILMNARAAFSALAFLSFGLLQAQLNVSTSLTPAQLVQNVLLGQGVSVSNITFNGSVYSTPQNGTGSFTTVSSNLGLDAGVILTTGLASNIGQDANNFASDNNGYGSDPDLVAITTPGNTINDKAIIEFDFIPTGDSLKFNYVFGSEEYPSFNCSANYNDVFGFFLSGPGISGPYTNNAINIALVPGTNLPVGIANIHGNQNTSCAPANAQYYIDNQSGTTVTFGGFTTILQALAEVECGVTYHIKLAIGDAGDSSYDSGVFLEAGSFSSTGQIVPSLTTGNAVVGVNDTTMFEGCGTIPFHFFRMGDTTNVDTVNLVIGGTSTPGVDYYPPIPTQLIYQPGDTVITISLEVPYDAEGLETLTIHHRQSCIAIAGGTSDTPSSDSGVSSCHALPL